MVLELFLDQILCQHLIALSWLLLMPRQTYRKFLLEQEYDLHKCMSTNFLWFIMSIFRLFLIILVTWPEHLNLQAITPAIAFDKSALLKTINGA